MRFREYYRNLPAVELDRFVRALRHVKSNGVVDRFAQMHVRHFRHGIHKSSHFLPWHREMLLRFERELQKYHPDVTIPYWDPTVDRSSADPLWGNALLGQFNSAWNLGRTFGATGGSLPTQGQVATNQSRTGYDSFWRELENPIHNTPHTWVGGAMAREDSPADPVFYLHHCWIDMLWARWQLTHPGVAFTSSGPGAGLHDPLMEWPDRTPAMVLDSRSLDVMYDVETALPTAPVARGDTMRPDEVLNPGQSITANNGRYGFVYQHDGNLVLYRNTDGRPLWASTTDGHRAGVCIMQGDGNLVVYRPSGKPVWSSHTWQHPGSRAVLQDDGNVVVYRPDGRPVWATNTWVPTGPTATGDTMYAGQVLNVWEAVTSGDGRFRFVYQGDGNLVLYRTRDGRALWASNTAGKPSGACIMQGDGNLVVYRPNGTPMWASNTPVHPGSRVVVQNDGNVVIYRPDGRPVWATNTVQ